MTLYPYDDMHWHTTTDKPHMTTTAGNIRLGYACINETLKAQTRKTASKTCIARTLTAKGIAYAEALAAANLATVLEILQWNAGE